MVKRTYQQVRRDIAENVKRARGRLGMSQEMLALSADVDRTWVSQIERGRGNPSIRVLAALAECLEVDLVDLLKPARSLSD